MSPGRIIGVDAARAVALLAMMLAHMHATTTPDGGATPIGAVVAGRASALFAVVAGVGVALSTAWVRDRRDHAGAAAGLLVRAACIALLGLGLEQLLGDPPAIILAQYGLLFVAAAVVVRLPATACFVAALGWCALSPVLSHLLREGGPGVPGPQPDLAMLIGSPVELLATLGLTGYYPVLTWITYLLVGMGVGRLDLRSRRTAARLVVVGTLLAVAALVASALLRAGGLGPAGVPEVLAQTQRAGTTPPGDPGWLVVSGRHTGTSFDLAHTVGSSLAAIGLLLLVARPARFAGYLGGPAPRRPHRRTARVRPVRGLPAGTPSEKLDPPIYPPTSLDGGLDRPAARVVALLAATGSASLTLYSGHILVTGTVGAFGTAAWALQVVAALTIGGVLLVTGRRGPLEALVGRASRAARRAVVQPGAERLTAGRKHFSGDPREAR